MLDFLGIGAQKAGTTWLYEMLSAHPQVHFPLGKEVHHWSRPGAKAEESYFAAWVGAPRHVRCGEITPSYSLLPVETIRAIRSFNPDMRVIFVMRNPIERAWSSALMALDRAGMLFEEASDAWFEDHFRSSGSIGRGDYESTLRRWRAVFPEEQILLLRFEEVGVFPSGLLDACARHLEVDVAPFRALPKDVVCRQVFRGPGKAMRPSLRAVLDALYRDRISALADYLGADLGAWLLDDRLHSQSDRANRD